jgi:hypothetical protein
MILQMRAARWSYYVTILTLMLAAVLGVVVVKAQAQVA